MTMKTQTLGSAAALLIAAIVAALQPAAEAQAPAPGQAQAQGLGKVSISGQALSFGTIATGATQPIQITINRWSPAGTRDRLIATFLEKKQDGLLRELQKLPELGRWKFPGYMGPDPNNIYRLGTPLRYATNEVTDEGFRRIVVMTDRIMGFQEVANQPRSYDYPFTLMEMHFDKDGKGEGRMLWYTQIKLDKKKNLMEIENYSSEPTRLNLLKLENTK